MLIVRARLVVIGRIEYSGEHTAIPNPETMEGRLGPSRASLA